MEKYLCNRNIVIRFLSLYLIGLIIFLIAWTLSYLFLPEGAVRGTSIANKISQDSIQDNLVKELITIFLYNTVSGVLIVLANLTLRIKKFPLGYIIPLMLMLRYGLVIGSNSFAIQMPEKMVPSFAVLQRSGLYEMMAYFLIAVATYSVSRYKKDKFFTRESTPISKDERQPMRKQDWAGVIISIVILFLSNFKEAFTIMNL